MRGVLGKRLQRAWRDFSSDRYAHPLAKVGSGHALRQQEHDFRIRGFQRHITGSDRAGASDRIARLVMAEQHFRLLTLRRDHNGNIVMQHVGTLPTPYARSNTASGRGVSIASNRAAEMPGAISITATS